MPATYSRRLVCALAFAIALACSRPQPPSATGGAPAAPATVDARLCTGCHQAIWNTYQKTGMARAFFRAEPKNMIEDFTRANRVEHGLSGRRYELSRRGGRYFLRRSQPGLGGREENVAEMEIHYVMGSGNHARSYLHRTPEGRMVELPVAWYAERGGYWAMSPGYDRPDHFDLTRQVTYDCMFCHNAYPRIDARLERAGSEPLFPAALPEGIDCQRCHGPGGAHAEAAQRKADVAAIRAAIVNPKRLPPDRRMEVCLQCHLETTSFALPNSVIRYDRGPFSYRPGEPLERFQLHLDHAPGAGREGKFEIVHAAYRLRQSACFLKSAGRLECTTCHNPHDVPRGAQAEKHYAAVCVSCHASLPAAHPKGAAACTGCHMPKRRTEDVVHAVMTDHRIQRRPPAGLTAPLAERHESGPRKYRGEVALYYPPALPDSPERDLYLAAAQVKARSNLEAGALRLAGALEKHRPTRPEFYFDLAQAYVALGQAARAIPLYEAALARDAAFLPARRSLGAALVNTGQARRAVEVMTPARTASPCDATLLNELARAWLQSGSAVEAEAAARDAARCDPWLADAHNTLAGILAERGARDEAEAALRLALHADPNHAQARSNLGSLLQAAGNTGEAEHHHRAAVKLRPDLAAARYGYATFLVTADRFPDARRELEAAIAADPRFAAAHELLGNVMEHSGDLAGAVRCYRRALEIDADFGRAHLSLGVALAALGDRAGARTHLERAASITGPLQPEAREALRQLGNRR